MQVEASYEERGRSLTGLVVVTGKDTGNKYKLSGIKVLSRSPISIHPDRIQLQVCKRIPAGDVLNTREETQKSFTIEEAAVLQV